MKKYKILFVEQPFWIRLSMGIKYINTYLNSKGIHSKIYCSFNSNKKERQFRIFLSEIAPLYSKSDKIFEEIVNLIVSDILSYNFEWIGFSYYFGYILQNNYLLEILKKIKEHRPETKIVVGGHAATFMPGHFLEKFNAARKLWGFGYVVYGEKDLYEMGIQFRSRKFWIDFLAKKYKIRFHNNSITRSLKRKIKLWQELSQ